MLTNNVEVSYLADSIRYLMWKIVQSLQITLKSILAEVPYAIYPESIEVSECIFLVTLPVGLYHILNGR